MICFKRRRCEQYEEDVMLGVGSKKHACGGGMCEGRCGTCGQKNHVHTSQDAKVMRKMAAWKCQDTCAGARYVEGLHSTAWCEECAACSTGRRATFFLAV